MRSALYLSALTIGLSAWVAWKPSAAETRPAARLASAARTARAPEARPFGIERRIPWTTSRVLGSPNPPLPYRVRRTFTRVKIVCPIAIAHEPGSDRLLMIHQLWPWGGSGRILRLRDDPQTDKVEVLLSLDRIAYGLAFHPHFKQNGFLFVGSNGPMNSSRKTTRVSRYTISRKPPFALDPRSEKVIIEWESDGHNGGDLAFGTDGLLYVSSGDGTSDSDTNLAGQDLSKLLSKVLRIDVDHPASDKAYSVPRDNPFLHTRGARPETWAYGFRNPWRLTCDRKTGDLWVGNNGQDLWEQVYLVRRGANYGWSIVEGSHPFYTHRKPGPTPLSKPIVEHPHSEMRSLTGGLVYYGSDFPELRGAYLYGDWSTGRIWAVRHQAGRVTWHRELANSTLQITGFGTDSRGELLIADHGGGIYRLERVPVEKHPARFPRRLSETGLFKSVKGHQVDPALIPYSVNASLWSDGADKERYIALPGTTRIDFTTSRGWNFPDGTVLVKTFALDLEAGNPASRRRIETRLLTRQQGQWAGYSYIWNDAQTDAVLVGPEGLDRVFAIREAGSSPRRRQQTWHYPSRAECMVCHSRAANWVLGLTELQMNKVHNYGAVSDNQLRTLEHLGVFRVNWVEHIQETRERINRFGSAAWQRVRASLEVLTRGLPAISAPTRRLLREANSLVALPLELVKGAVFKPLDRLHQWLNDHPRYTTLLPKRPEQYRRLVDPYDARENLDARARSYLHANCAQCHVAAGGGNALMELEFTTEPDKMNIFRVRPQHDQFGLTDARLITPGHPARSVLWQRLARRGPGQMPPLATSVVDREAVAMLRAWISQLRPNVGKPVRKE